MEALTSSFWIGLAHEVGPLLKKFLDQFHHAKDSAFIRLAVASMSQRHGFIRLAAPGTASGDS
jgi:hypothetical protein